MWPTPLSYANLLVSLGLDRSGPSALSGRSAAWLARLVRDQEVDGSNPFAPTIPFRSLTIPHAQFPYIMTRAACSRPKNLFDLSGMGMLVSVEIAQLRSEQLRELRDFLRLAYPQDARKSAAQFINWYYRQNPNVSMEHIPVWIAMDAGKIVGQLATILVQLKTGTVYTKAIWILEFILLPEYRGRGLGKRLVLAARDHYPTMITLGINEASTRVFNSLGWVSLGSIHRFHKLLYAGNAVRRLANFGLLRESFNWLSAPMRYSLAKRTAATKYELTHGMSLDPSVDELWTTAAPQWPCAVRREQKFVNWQFREQPGKVFHVIQLYKQGRLVGYAILFFRKGPMSGVPPKAAISDFVYDRESPDEIIEALLEAALQTAVKRKVGSLVTDVLDARLEAHLRRRGFWRIKKSPRFMASTQEFQGLLYSAKNWFLTRADSDVSIFEEPNVD
jgi:GNAT superfamily N-acetyltransferase